MSLSADITHDSFYIIADVADICRDSPECAADVAEVVHDSRDVGIARVSIGGDVLNVAFLPELVTAECRKGDLRSGNRRASGGRAAGWRSSKAGTSVAAGYALASGGSDVVEEIGETDVSTGGISRVPRSVP